MFSGSSDNNNVSITYLTAGDKSNPTILLIHGNGAIADDWSGVMQDMSNDFYLIAPYRRGTTPSDQPNTGDMKADYSLAITATDFMLILQQEGVSNPHIIAHSYSGRFAEQYYFQYGTDTTYSAKTITLLATSFSGSIQGTGLITINNAITAGNINDVATAFANYAVTVSCNEGSCLTSENYTSLQQEVYNGAIQTSIYAYQSYMEVGELASSNFVPASINIPTIPFSGPTTANSIGTFADINIPVYIIGGDQDEINPPINLSILAVLFPNSFVEELRGVPHFSSLTNYQVLADKFTNFINQVDEPCSFLYN